jgi:two-component system cell cycle sensor histidine kinase/response regulator CckA
MGEYKRLALLILIMIGVCSIVGATTIGVIYNAALDRERARLVNIAQSQARLMEALAHLEMPARTEEQPSAGALSEILEAHRLIREQGIGQTAEVQLARRDGDLIVFVTPARGSHQPHNPVTFGGPAAEPMTEALSGRSGTMIGRDYAGRRVLAAFEPVPHFGLGLVAKIDMREINQRYLRAGAIAGLVSLAAVLGAALLFFGVGEPIIRRLRESESRYRELFDNMDIGVAVYHARSRDGDFVLKDFNRAGEHIAQIDRRHLIDRTLTQIFPGVREFGLIDVLTRVRQTGNAERLPTRYYRDGRIEGWRDVYVYKLPNGEIVSLFADVSERERQAEALRQSEQRYRTLVEGQPDPICQFLPDTTLTFVNRAYARFYGTTPEALIGKRWLDFAVKEERPRFLEELSSFTPTNPERHEETRSTRADREVRWYLCHLYGLFDDAGNIVSFQTFGTDITERKRAEGQLAQQLGLLTAITDSAADAIFVSDSDGRVTLINPAAERIFGWSRQELTGRKLHDAIHDRHPDGRPYPASECPLSRVYATGETLVRHEDVFFHKDGSQVPVACSNAPLMIEGRIAGSVLVAHDITERKRTEAALRESEARYRTAGEAIRYGVWVCNPEGGVEFVSRTFLDLIGKTLDEVKPRGWLDRLPPEDLKPTLDAWRECVRTGSEWTWEHRVKGKDAVWRTILSLGRPVRDDRDRITSWVGFNLDISGRKEAEDALRESEARLRRTVEHAPFPVMVHAEGGEVVHISQAWLDLTGYAREEIGTIAAWTERAYGEGKELVRADIDQLHALDRAVDEGEYLVRTADGRTRVWTFHSAPLGSDGHGRRLVVSMAADVTERKKGEDALRESENRMRALLDASQDEILLMSTQGEVLAINKAAERRLARRTGGADPVGAPLDTLLPRDQVESRMAIVRQVAATATLVHCEVSIRWRWFEFWFYPVLQPDRPVSEVAVYAREITQQKKSQADLGKLFQAVQQSPMSVVITDCDGNIEYVNPEFTKVTGYTLAEAVGQNPRILKSGHTPPEQYAELWDTISAGGVWRGELLNKRRNGELFWELASIAPVKQGDKITNFVAVKEDITERKQMEEQLRQSQKMQALGQLTGGIAHDFNNLIAIVMGNLQLLRERVGGDARIREFLDDALWSARRGGELTHRLLAFARKQPLKPTIIDLNEVVRGITELLRRTLGMGIRVEELLAPDLWKAFADRGELERALVNLAVNSRDAMRGAGTLTLETRNALLDEDYAEQYEEVTPGEYVLLAVTDTGTGMPPEITERVFEPFFTTKEVGQGSGLGLSMVYGFVKQSGGHVSVYSRVGQGTSVKLYLPRAPSSPTRPKEESPDMSSKDLRNRVVLVVEDEPKLRKVAVKMLERLGLRSMQAETAKDALEFLADTHIDVLFTDIELPGGMNGTELADAAQKLDPNIKVLFTTGYAREAVLHDRWLREKVPWLLKPYSHQELARELRGLLAPTVH